MFQIVRTATRFSVPIFLSKHKATSGQSAKEIWFAVVVFLTLSSSGYS